MLSNRNNIILGTDINIKDFKLVKIYDCVCKKYKSGSNTSTNGLAIITGVGSPLGKLWPFTYL